MNTAPCKTPSGADMQEVTFTVRPDENSGLTIHVKFQKPEGDKKVTDNCKNVQQYADVDRTTLVNIPMKDPLIGNATRKIHRLDLVTGGLALSPEETQDIFQRFGSIIHSLWETLKPEQEPSNEDVPCKTNPGVIDFLMERDNLCTDPYGSKETKSISRPSTVSKKPNAKSLGRSIRKSESNKSNSITVRDSHLYNVQMVSNQASMIPVPSKLVEPNSESVEIIASKRKIKTSKSAISTKASKIPIPISKTVNVRDDLPVADSQTKNLSKELIVESKADLTSNLQESSIAIKETTDKVTTEIEVQDSTNLKTFDEVRAEDVETDKNLKSTEENLLIEETKEASKQITIEGLEEVITENKNAEEIISGDVKKLEESIRVEATISKEPEDTGKELIMEEAITEAVAEFPTENKNAEEIVSPDVKAVEETVGKETNVSKEDKAANERIIIEEVIAETVEEFPTENKQVEEIVLEDVNTVEETIGMKGTSSQKVKVTGEEAIMDKVIIETVAEFPTKSENVEHIISEDVKTVEETIGMEAAISKEPEAAGEKVVMEKSVTQTLAKIPTENKNADEIILEDIKAAEENETSQKAKAAGKDVIMQKPIAESLAVFPTKDKNAGEIISENVKTVEETIGMEATISKESEAAGEEVIMKEVVPETLAEATTDFRTSKKVSSEDNQANEKDTIRGEATNVNQPQTTEEIPIQEPEEKVPIEETVAEIPTNNKSVEGVSSKENGQARKEANIVNEPGMPGEESREKIKTEAKVEATLKNENEFGEIEEDA